MNVIITGGTKGIGRAILNLFFDKGANVAFCARNQSDIDLLKSELLDIDPNRQVIGMSVDVSDSDQLKEFNLEINRTWSHIDVLINNAGVFLPGEILKEENGALEFMIETNLYSAYRLSRLVAPTMIQQSRGHIFNICSIASLIALPNGGSYTISKFAMLGFSKVLREELKPTGVKVTSVLPGATWSNSWAGVELPQERLMEAVDIAKQIWAAYDTAPSAVIEEIIIRPQLGDL